MTAPAPPSQPKVEDARRVVIDWRQGAYYVNIPNWRGGTVVDASDYDALRAKVDELTAALTRIEAKLNGERPTVNEQNAFEHFNKLNALLVEVRSDARAALAVNSQDRG